MQIGVIGSGHVGLVTSATVSFGEIELEVADAARSVQTTKR